MSHRAAVYEIYVRPARKHDPPLERLGDLGGNGIWLGDVLNGYLDGTFEAENQEGNRSISCESTTIDGDEVCSIFSHGMSGLAADIVASDGSHKARQNPTDTAHVLCGSVFRLNRSQTRGFWAVHVNNGRSTKGLTQAELIKRFNLQFSDLTLKVEPVVNEQAVIEAARQGKIGSIVLSRLEKPSDRAVAETENWVHSTDIGKIEVKLKGESHLSGDLLRKFFSGDSQKADAAKKRILKFAGIEFESAKVEVELAEGRRSFNIESPDSGHPITRDLENLKLDQGEPTKDSLFGALSQVLDDLT
ncbi:hypothetical protein [Patulibacter defluvii]|uniref:hypothetical protein n=1 Tax=Patulibacter defluvii TaxID=3095358 RepID=UPI002A757ED7|nr:hypothetical protein [Patulibacter sp. DM4]